MAENLTPYKLDVTAAEANSGIITAAQIAKTPGIPFSNGQNVIRLAVPGTDYGLPLIQGNGAPSTTVSGSLGQHYFDMLAAQPPYEYVCTGVTENGYVWRVYGDTGTNFAPVGRFETLSDLKNAIEAGDIPSPTPGIAYYIGTAAPYAVYVYDAVAEDWFYNGELTSSQGSSVQGIPPHGEEDDVLVKLSNADYDAAWKPLPELFDNSPLPVTSGGTGATTADTARENLNAAQKPLVFKNISVPASAFSKTSKTENYPYSAKVALANVTAEMSPEVNFGLADATSGDLAGASESYNGGVEIFAEELPSAAVIIAEAKFTLEG